MSQTQRAKELGYISAFGASEKDKLSARDEIVKLAKERSVFPASIHNLYLAFGRGEVAGFSVPACNIRALTFDTARLVFRLLKEIDASSFIFEIARGELGYTDQSAHEYASSILAAAVAEEWTGPVFIQADHTQFSAAKFRSDPEAAIGDLKEIILRSIEAGFYNIDIDASTLVDLSKEDLDEQQKQNYQMTARLTEYVRSLQPEGITVSVGGEIGHIGGKNSTVADFRAFMNGFLKEYTGTGLSKVSIQTGTSHGGIMLPDGTMKKVNLDFDVLREIGDVARKEFGLGGPVQHGASTLPIELFDRFPQTGTVEVHLATGFQNTIFSALPEPLLAEIHAWTLQNCASERSPDWNDEQLIYKLRKKANKPFKKRLWELTDNEKEPVLSALENDFRQIFSKLNIKGNSMTVRKFIQAP